MKLVTKIGLIHFGIAGVAIPLIAGVLEAVLAAQIAIPSLIDQIIGWAIVLLAVYISSLILTKRYGTIERESITLSSLLIFFITIVPFAVGLTKIYESDPLTSSALFWLILFTCIDIALRVAVFYIASAYFLLQRAPKYFFGIVILILVSFLSSYVQWHIPSLNAAIESVSSQNEVTPYENYAYDFSFGYPADWELNEEAVENQYEPALKFLVIVNAPSRDKQFSVSVYNDRKAIGDVYFIGEQQPVTISDDPYATAYVNKKGYECDDPSGRSCGTFHITVQSGAYWYVLSGNGGKLLEDSAFKNIIRTFKFTD